MPFDSFGQSKGNRKTIIVIDPGHGGTDSGAIGINGIQEKDVVLKIAKEIVRLNEEPIWRVTLKSTLHEIPIL